MACDHWDNHTSISSQTLSVVEELDTHGICQGKHDDLESCKIHYIKTFHAIKRILFFLHDDKNDTSRITIYQGT